MIVDEYKRFNYVLDKSKRSEVCFGSSLPREVLPRSGPSLTPFMRIMGATRGTSLGPYLGQRPLSSEKIKLGVIGRSPRWVPERSQQTSLQNPSKARPIKSAFVPFNQSSKRSINVSNATPGVGTYNPSDVKRELKFFHSFGGKKSIVPAVDIKCVPYNEDTCAICNMVCNKQGDYWHKENKVFLCRSCIEDVFRNQKRYKTFNFKDFKPMRDCFFAHHHEKFKNAVKLMDNRNIRKKVNKETYLNQYFSDILDRKYTY